METPTTVMSAHRAARPLRLCLAALVLTSLALPGCVGSPDELDIAVEELNANSRAAYDFFRSKGLTPVQAAGIVGNLMQESNCNPMAVQSGGPGRGIAQWSVGGRWDHDSGDNAVAYASSRGASVWSLGLQLDFIWYELTTFSRYGLAQLRAATTVSAAVTAFEARFEVCGTCISTQRIAYANQALAAYGSDAASTWGATFVSQSFPYASAGSVSVVAGRTASVSITLRNSGTRAWDARTCIATTVPRDRRSPFAGSEWPGANRPSCVASGRTVAAGASYTFTWTMHAPASAGRYDEHWGVVEEGAAWFSDPGQGGPADNNLEGIFVVTAAPPPVDAGVRDSGVRDVAPVDVYDAPTSDSAGDDVATSDVAIDDAPTEDASVDDVVTEDAAIDDAAIEDGGLFIDDGVPLDDLKGGCSCSARGATPARPWIGAALALALVTRWRRRTRRDARRSPQAEP